VISTSPYHSNRSLDTSMSSALTRSSVDRQVLSSLDGFQQFPWHCGFVLELGSLEEKLRQWLQDQPTHFQRTQHNVILVSDIWP
jgi:hypothetical protein